MGMVYNTHDVLVCLRLNVPVNNFSVMLGRSLTASWVLPVLLGNKYCSRTQYGALRERLRTHKVFTNDQCFYLNYHKFSIKSYVVDVY